MLRLGRKGRVVVAQLRQILHGCITRTQPLHERLCLVERLPLFAEGALLGLACQGRPSRQLTRLTARRQDRTQFVPLTSIRHPCRTHPVIFGSVSMRDKRSSRCAPAPTSLHLNGDGCRARTDHKCPRMLASAATRLRCKFQKGRGLGRRVVHRGIAAERRGVGRGTRRHAWRVRAARRLRLGHRRGRGCRRASRNAWRWREHERRDWWQRMEGGKGGRHGRLKRGWGCCRIERRSLSSARVAVRTESAGF
mmetsp:Transcript_13738/g.41823  ORF Transcript_13738/g.41823 Transcript_13738/m.41823 type:complete len:251 (+) Transcript_13738:1178-1930(+)|eukprot:scaffold279656_cov30-Tisochrysis_lutea.AAC.4